MGSHQKTFVALAQQYQWTTGAEVGVQRGFLSRKLLDTLPALHLIGVDNFSMSPEYRHEVEALVDEYPLRYRLLAMDAHDAAAEVPDHSLDFVFLDADHGEEATVREITDWRSKVRPGGWFGGDAYNPEHYPQTVRAVHRFYKKVDVLPGRVWGVRC